MKTMQMGKVYRTGHGIGFTYVGNEGGVEVFHLTADNGHDENKAYPVVAHVLADQGTRMISISDPAGHKTVETKGRLELTFTDGVKTSNTFSVAQYVVPRVAVLLARLYAIA